VRKVGEGRFKDRVVSLMEAGAGDGGGGGKTIRP